MSFIDFKNWMTLNESSSTNSLSALEEYVDTNPNLSVYDYDKILSGYTEESAKYSQILDEAGEFISFCDQLEIDARKEVKDTAEYLIKILYGGVEQNVAGEPDKIFSDVKAGNDNISVKSSKNKGFGGVLGNTPIKINQILSIIFKNGTAGVEESEKAKLIKRIVDNDKPQLPDGSYSIATVFHDGVDVTVVKTGSVSAETIWNSLQEVKDELPSWKKNLNLTNIKQLGFSPIETKRVLGLKQSEINAKIKERQSILQDLKSLDMKTLRALHSQLKK
jgi:hypothetical protein